MISTDDLWPRDAAHRYRLYELRGGKLHVLAASATPEGAGIAAGRLAEEEGPLGPLGILDVRPGKSTGRWLANPHPRRMAAP